MDSRDYTDKERILKLERENQVLISALDNEMVVTHLGVFASGDDPKLALNSLCLYWQGVGEYFVKQELCLAQETCERLDGEIESLRKEIIALRNPNDGVCDEIEMAMADARFSARRQYAHREAIRTVLSKVIP